MKSAEVTIWNRLGLHARPAAKLVKIASSGNSQVFLVRNDQRINARSILGVMLLAADYGSKIRFEVDGPDETDILEQLIELVVGKFGEDE
ncbi:MAG: HPr family phosphocarrier protein [Calditrichaeota bacterium]|nr:HPr family phosphocarrier protein [Calditrichota bacterium]